jgi:hypothetical protein
MRKALSLDFHFTEATPQVAKPPRPQKMRPHEVPRSLFSAHDLDVEASRYAFIGPSDVLLRSQNQQLFAIRTQINKTAGGPPRIIRPVTAIGNISSTSSLLCQGGGRRRL